MWRNITMCALALALAGCATLAPAEYPRHWVARTRNGPVRVVVDRQDRVDRACRKAGAHVERDQRIYGCYIYRERVALVAAQAYDSLTQCYVRHELAHADGWQHGPGDSSCGPQ